MEPWCCCSQWGRRGFKPPGPGGINTSNTGDRAMKGEMESKHGCSNQQAYALTYYGDTAAQHLPPLASAPSICCVCTEYKPTSTQKCTSTAARRGVERGAGRVNSGSPSACSSDARLFTLQSCFMMQSSHADTPAERCCSTSSRKLNQLPGGGLRSEHAAKEHRSI